MANLICKDLSQYRYSVEATCFVHFSAGATVLALKGVRVEHPFFKIENEGVRVQAGYAWDGATGVLWQSKNLIIPSLVHDIGCQAVNLKLLPRSMRRVFDYEYRQQALKHGVSPLRVEIHYAGISVWGMIPKQEAIAAYSKTITVEIL